MALMVFVDGKHDKALSEKYELKDAFVKEKGCMRGILIDPENGTITEVNVAKGIDAIYKLIDADCFDIQRLGKNVKQENDIYVDDNGLCGQINFGFQYGENQPIVGKGLILGSDPNTGDSIDTNLGLEVVKLNTKLLKTQAEFILNGRAWSRKYE